MALTLIPSRDRVENAGERSCFCPVQRASVHCTARNPESGLCQEPLVVLPSSRDVRASLKSTQRHGWGFRSDTYHVEYQWSISSRHRGGGCPTRVDDDDADDDDDDDDRRGRGRSHQAGSLAWSRSRSLSIILPPLFLSSTPRRPFVFSLLLVHQCE